MSDNEETQLQFSTVLASTIHDMKNSLGMVINSLDGFLEEVPEDCGWSRDQLFKLQYETKRVNANLIQLLTFYKVGDTSYSGNISEYQVCDFIEENYLLNKPLFDFGNIDVEFACEEELPWFFDRELVAGVLENAVNNAIRYTDGKLLLAADERDGFLCLRVEDNGPGFPDGMLTRTAEHDDGDVDFGSGRTGLGLHFSNLVAKLHRNGGRRGYIELSNNGVLGGGTFAIYLP